MDYSVYLYCIGMPLILVFVLMLWRMDSDTQLLEHLESLPVTTADRDVIDGLNQLREDAVARKLLGTDILGEGDFPYPPLQLGDLGEIGFSDMNSCASLIRKLDGVYVGMIRKPETLTLPRNYTRWWTWALNVFIYFPQAPFPNCYHESERRHQTLAFLPAALAQKLDRLTRKKAFYFADNKQAVFVFGKGNLKKVLEQFGINMN
ncbi:MAG TPA: hypothetical protein VM901_03185 [Bdellovibrionota bacterium]|jgi:hypothetical protein|nr:hypothetical protein [Bdellovibrionota bacterium]